MARVRVAPESVAIAPDERHQFTAVAQNLSGEPVEGRAFTWMSSDTTVATIDADGRATARAPGTAHITATTGGIASPPAQINVASGSRREGMFVNNLGASYEVKGTVTLETDSDGDLVVRLAEDFSTSQAPGVHIYLSASNAVSGTSLDLGEMRSFSGADTYVVGPSSVTLDTFDWVVIHCKPFNVTFGYAELQ